MKNNIYIMIVIFLILIALILLSINFLNNKVFFYFDRNIRNLNKIFSIDQITEALVKSTITEVTLSSIYKASENSFSKNIWDSYPKCLNVYLPSISEIKKDIERNIKNNLKEFEDFIYMLNLLLFFYPVKIFVNIDNTTIIFPFDEKDLLSGKIDDKFSIIFDNIEISLLTPNSLLKKKYKFEIELTNIRLFYIYRKIRDWILSGRYQNIIKKYSNDIFFCIFGYTVTRDYSYKCEAQKKQICIGEEIKRILQQRIEKTNVKVCTTFEKRLIEQNNAVVLATCKDGKIIEDISCKFSNCIISYKNTDNEIKENINNICFAVSGSGSTIPSEKNPDSCPNPEIVEKYKCIEILIREEPTGNTCYIERPYSRDILCLSMIECPQKDQIFKIINIIKNEIEKEINNLFLTEDRITCKVNINFFDYQCKILNNTEIDEQKCFCLTKEVTESTIRVVFYVSCTDKKYQYYINNKLENLKLDFTLTIYGMSKCNLTDINIDKKDIYSYCCEIMNIASSKICCAGIDNNGNCIPCPPAESYSELKKKENVLCIQ